LGVYSQPALDTATNTVVSRFGGLEIPLSPLLWSYPAEPRFQK